VQETSSKVKKLQAIGYLTAGNAATLDQGEKVLQNADAGAVVPARIAQKRNSMHEYRHGMGIQSQGGARRASVVGWLKPTI